jgi:predicted Zn-dependent protease
MRWIVFFGMVVCAAAARGEDIVDVLQRSQQMRLAAMQPAADGAAARALQANFERLLKATAFDQPVHLQVVDDDNVAETLLGRVVVVHARLGERPPAEQLFVLAHELGHVAQRHQAQMGQLYLKWVPGPVLQEHTDAVAPLLGRDASGLAHRQEFAADAFALRTLCAMGHTRDEVLAIFMRLGMNPTTATHPGSTRRMAALRAEPLEDQAQGDARLAQAR